MEEKINQAKWLDGPASSIGSRCSDRTNCAMDREHGAPAQRKVHCSYKINPVAELFAQMKGHKKVLLGQMKFGGLMHLPRIETSAVKSVNRQLAFWLLMRLNSNTGALEFGDNATIPLTVNDIALILGISCEGKDIMPSDTASIDSVKQSIKKILLLGDKDVLDLDTIRAVLDRDLTETSDKSKHEAFLVAAAIYATSYFLAPKGRPTRLNTDIMQSLLDPTNVYKLNWSSYVLRTLKECSKKVQNDVRAQTKTVSLDGCLLVLQIAYLDNLNFGQYSTTHCVIPRVKSFTKEIMDKLTNLDKAHCQVGAEFKFGQTQIRHASETIYSRGIRYREMLASKTEISDADTLIEYIDQSNEMLKRQMKNAHWTFWEKQHKDIDDYNKHLTTIVKTWASLGKVTVKPPKRDVTIASANFTYAATPINQYGAQETPDHIKHARSGKRKEDEHSLEQTGLSDHTNDMQVTTPSIEGGEEANEANMAEKRILLAQGNMLTFTNEGIIATNNKGRTKHVPYRKAREKKKQKLEDTCTDQ